MSEGQSVAGAGQVKEIDLGSIPRKLARLRLTDYAMVFVGGPMFIAMLAAPLVAASGPTIAVLGIALIGGLCLLVGYRDFGVLRPSNWVDYTLVLPLPIIAMGLAVYEAARAASLSDDVITMLYWFGLLAAGALVGFPTVLQLMHARLDCVETKLSVWLTRVNAHGVGWPRVGKVPVIDRRRGLLLSAFGIAVLAANVIVPALLPADLQRGLNSPGLFITFAGYGLLLRARRYFQVSADALLAADHRSPILLLRSFEDDEKAQFGGGDRQLLDFSIETRLASHFLQFGPFIAVGSPQDTVPQIGAARAKLADDQWQSAVLGWMNASAVVLMLAGKTKWVTWELGRLVEGQHVHKLILLLPVKGFRRAKRRADALARVEHVRSAFAGTPWETALNGIERPETVRAITFGPAGSLTLVRATSASRDAYHVAALLAHDLILSPAVSAAAEPAPARASHRKLLAAAAAVALLALLPAFNPDLLTPLCERSAAVCKLAGLNISTSRIAGALSASKELFALAKAGDLPRISEPAAQRLLARIFDTSVLTDKSAALSLPDIARWFDAIQATYSLYLLHDTQITDIGEAIATVEKKPALEQKMAANVAAYQEEIGPGLDAQMTVLGRLAELAVAQFATAGNEQTRNGMAIMRRAAAANLVVDLWSIYLPPVSNDWRRQRMQALARIVPAAVPLLTPQQRRALTNLANDGADKVEDQTLREGFLALADIFGAGLPIAKIADSIKAGREFLQLAKGGAPPRISDPAVKLLLSRLFDTSVLTDTSAAPSLQDIARWFDTIQAAYSGYLLHDTQMGDIAEAIRSVGHTPGLEQKMAANVGAYQEEIGFGLDAQMAVLGRLAELAVPRFAAADDEQARNALTNMRSLATANLIIDLWSIYIPPVSDDWRHQRLGPLTRNAPAAARLLLEDQREALANLAHDGADHVKDQTLRDGLLGVIRILRTPH